MGKVIAAVIAGMVSIAASVIGFAIEHSDGADPTPVSVTTPSPDPTEPSPSPEPTEAPEPSVMGGDIFEVELSSGDPCCTFSVGVELEGLQGEESVLSVVVFDADFDEAIDGWDVATLEAEADVDRAHTDAEVMIDVAGHYYLRFILYDPDGVELDHAETDAFEVLA